VNTSAFTDRFEHLPGLPAAHPSATELASDLEATVPLASDKQKPVEDRSIEGKGQGRDLIADRGLDAELLAMLKATPLEGLARIYDMHASLVYGLAYAVLGNRQEAEDLTQEIFVGLINKCTYDVGRGSLAGYLTTMTRSRAIDQLRARQRSARLLGTWGDGTDGQKTAATALEEVADGERASSVKAALAALPVSQRQVLELAYFKGLTHVEIAAVLQAPLGTVKTWARNGLYTLRESLRNFVE